MAQKKKPTFEEALSELEEITRLLESGELTLDQSVEAYEKGMELKKACYEMLSTAEKKLEYLEKKDGELKRVALASENMRADNRLFEDDDSED
ncbi:MAG TPA: exodeoxyribonuclease VII small subunit [Leptospiraceae bacterium]|jgi:exodeoxyribonuclease VII small subunit|nr:exodeoxyribonuclease VII small subunit [Leptospirales bacterium]HMU82136.1 exodeoxyribonuclease VII small subunit [Leptospiraceae bacterium]HMW58844.1 exodeoxyribonuclease VII small subunit [Leptospiraceae bacterium]HMX57941.1 exodeoxyribonuclease VII small subunit [Leptospiraceae bacterium]HNE25084.1 exodeoxyribonuclease VII small subunit [Leptospiraceae bacterium]